MANPTNTNPNRASLAGRVAADKKQAAEVRQIKTRVASAYTLAKTMLPSAPAEQHVKLAQNLLLNSTPVLASMLRQAAVNAHFTRVAEEFKNIHKVDLNDLLDNPSILSKERSSVVSELKGDPKNAAAKVADDRKECGEQPATYDEGKRTEPTDLDAGDATDPAKQKIWAEGGEGKVAAAKKACGDECKGCDGCGKKEAAAKVAEEGAEGAPVDQEAAGEGATEDNPVEEAAADHEDAAAEEGAEGSSEAEEGDSEGGEHAEGEVFDEEAETLKDAITDVKDDIATLEEAINSELGDADDINLAEEAAGEGDFDAALEDGGLDDVLNEGAPAGDPGMEGAPEELNIENIFSDDNFADKVSALNDDEGGELDAEAAWFEPSNPAELEGVLDQEEALSSPADMFAVEEVNDDPMSALFTSSKQAASTEGVVKPGELVGHFEADHGSEGRDSDTDHEDDLLTEVVKSLKPESNDQKRDKQDSTSELKGPKQATAKRVASKKTTSATEFPKLATHFDPLAAAGKIAGGNLASLVFADEADYM